MFGNGELCSIRVRMSARASQSVQKNTGAYASALDLIVLCARRCGSGEFEREMARLPCSGVVTGGASECASMCVRALQARRGLPGAARVVKNLAQTAGAAGIVVGMDVCVEGGVVISRVELQR